LYGPFTGQTATAFSTAELTFVTVQKLLFDELAIGVPQAAVAVAAVEGVVVGRVARPRLNRAGSAAVAGRSLSTAVNLFVGVVAIGIIGATFTIAAVEFAVIIGVANPSGGNLAPAVVGAGPSGLVTIADIVTAIPSSGRGATTTSVADLAVTAVEDELLGQVTVWNSGSAVAVTAISGAVV